MKQARRREREKRDSLWRERRDNARTWEELDKALGKLVRVNGHLVHAFCEWVRSKFEPDHYLLLGAPFEADAQLVYLEKEGYTVGTLTVDSDLFFYDGCRNLHSGFNTRSVRKYRSIIERDTTDPYFSSLTPRSLLALASFMGTDYIEHLKGIGTWYLYVVNVPRISYICMSCRTCQGARSTSRICDPL